MLIYTASQPLEKVSHYAPLGIRFWDLTRDMAITDGLQVAIRPPDRPDLSRRAFQTPTGIYAFRNLPGLRSLEASNPAVPPGAHPEESSPPQSHRFVVEVKDRLRRFLTATFQLTLPYQGIYPTRPAASPPETSLPGFFLFSAPERTMLTDIAVLRAQLVERLPDGRFRPASYAVLEATIIEPDGVSSGAPVVGIADERGAVLVAFPCPLFATAIGPMSPPPSEPETRLQEWEVIVRVRYAPANQTRPDTAAHLPDLGAVLTQPFAHFLPTAAGVGHSQLNARLVFGRPLRLQTAGASDLWIIP